MQPDFEKRRARLWRRARKAGVSAFLVSNEINVRYLTGFTGDSSFLWIDQDQQLLISDSRYTIQIADECPGLQTVTRDSGSTKLDAVASVARSCRPVTLGVESGHLTKAFFDALQARLAVELVDTEGWVESLRCIKDRWEIDRIRELIRINQRAFEVIQARLTGDQTERQIAHNLESQIRTFGGSRCAFDPIVGVGARSALPHGVPSDTRIEESGFVLIDWGAQVDGYASDLTRVLVTAKIPPKIRKIYEIVLNAQLAAIAKIRPGVSFKVVDAVARQIIDEAGFGKKFGHGLGHGFGLEIHERPFISPIGEGIFQPRMVVTVEPGIYLPGIGGVRIEDDVLVTKDGNEVLSSLPKSFDECVVEI